MVKKIFFILFLCKLVILSEAQYVKVFLNDKDCEINVEEKEQEYEPQYTIGRSSTEIKVYRIVKSDTSLFFLSLGCSQYSFDKKSLTIYSWLDNYYEEDCLCIDEDELPCRPDTSLCDIKFQYRYVANKPLLSISKIYYQEFWLDSVDMSKMDSLSFIEWKNYVKLTKFNKIFKDKKYDYSYTFTYGIMSNYMFLPIYNHIQYYLFNKQKYNTYLKLTYNVNFLTFKNRKYNVTNYDYYGNYCRNIVKYLWPLQNCHFKGNKISIFQKKMKKLIIKSYGANYWT